jgi:hypothetical protein
MPTTFGSPGDGRRGLSELGGGPEGEDDGRSDSLQHISSFELRNEQENLLSQSITGMSVKFNHLSRRGAGEMENRKRLTALPVR